MAAVRYEMRKRSAESVAQSQQIAEYLNDDENSQSQELDEKHTPAASDDDEEYVPERSATDREADAEGDEKEPVQRPRKRRNSAQSSASEQPNDSVAESALEVQDRKADETETGPLSDRARFLPAGTHAAVQSHAQSLFAIAFAQENASRAADPIALAIDIEMDASSQSSSPRSDSSAGSSSSSGASSSPNGSSSSSPSSASPSSHSHSPVHAGVGRLASDKDAKEEEQSAAARRSPSPSLPDGPADDDNEGYLSPLLVDFRRPALRGLSASPRDRASTTPPPPEIAPLSLSPSVRDEKDGQYDFSHLVACVCSRSVSYSLPLLVC
jgi:hypothetical protein